MPEGDGRTLELLTGISSQPRDRWSGDVWMFRGAASERFQGLEEVVSTLPCWGGAWGNREGDTSRRPLRTPHVPLGGGRQMGGPSGC